MTATPGHAPFAKRGLVLCLFAFWIAVCSVEIAPSQEPNGPQPGQPAKPVAEPPAPAQPVQKAAPPKPAQVQIQVQGGNLQIRGNVVVNGKAVGLSGTAGDVPEDMVFRNPDRALLQRLTKSETLVEEGRYAEAVEMLGGILEQSEDYFYRPDKQASTSRSLKAEASRRIGALPPEGREAYELQYGVKAKQMLAAAIDAGDENGLIETSRRYFHTAAGLQATYLLGLTHLDEGHPLAAALCWQRLSEVPAGADFEPELSLQLATAWARAGNAESAYETLSKASQHFPGAVLTIAGRPQRWPIGADSTSRERSMTWLAQVAAAKPVDADADRLKTTEWLLAGGDAARNAVSTGGNPLLNRRWAVPYVNHPEVEKLTEQLARGYADRDVGPLPAAQPLAVNDVILMRTLAGLTAVDFRTGKRIWRGAPDEYVDHLLERESPLAGRTDQEAGQLAYLVEQRLWRDTAFGTSSSDGRRVFCIEDAMPSSEAVQRNVIFANGRRISPGVTQQSPNRLAAYDLETEGKLIWELGGPAVRAEEAAEGAIFLGPPLPLGDKLYVLGELKGEIRLYVVKAATGRIEWTQQVALAHMNDVDLEMRRTCGLSPSYADGVLVCPTALGAVVAIDPNDRSLLWGFQYERAHASSMGNRIFMWQLQSQADGVDNNDRWHDGLLELAEGKALVAPPESNSLFCLNLLDGTKVWEAQRDHGLYVAGVVDDLALVVAASEMRAYRLSDGAIEWKFSWPEGVRPSGRGFSNGRLYFVPLSTAEVAAVDIAAGKIVAHSRSRSGNVPGNLVCYRGSVLSQGVAGLECFYQLDDLKQAVLAKLRENPNDPQALASQGELLLDEGKTAEAIEALRKSFTTAADPRTRNLLVDALLEGLSSGLVTTETDLADLETLASGTIREENYLRLLANAHEKAGDDARALAVYLRLVDLPPTSELLKSSSTISIRRDRWVEAKLGALASRANDDLRRKLSTEVARRREAVLKSDDPATMRNFLEHFGDQLGADEVRLHLAIEAEKSNRLLEAENLLRSISTDGEAADREATARLAMLFCTAGLPADARPYLSRLQSEFADEICLGGKRGRQIAAELKDLSMIDKPHAWPVGKVEISEGKPSGNSGYRAFTLEFRGERGPTFANLSIEMDQPLQALVVRDDLGIERWRVSLVDAAERRIGNNINPMVSHVRVGGHLMILSLGHEIVAIDTLGPPGAAESRILWRTDLTDPLIGIGGMQGIHQRNVQMQWGVQRLIALDSSGKSVGVTGPVTSRYVSFLKQRSLYVVEPLTGKPLWIRHDVDSGSDLFGDEEFIFITPPTNNDKGLTTVVRVSDGETVKQVKLPPFDQRVTSYGRRLLTWGHERGKSVLSLIDGFTEQRLWSETFAADGRLWPTASDEVGVFTRAGKLTVLAVADGEKRLEATVMPEPQLNEAFVFRTTDSYLLVTSSPLRPKDGLNIQPVPGGSGNPLINGYVYGFDRQTHKQLFRTRVAGHGMTVNQPAGLPMLVFASQVYEQPKRGGQMRSPEAVLLCIDKRNGRVLYDKRLTAPINIVDLTADPDNNTISLRTLRSSLQFKFTDEPPSPDDAKTPGAARVENEEQSAIDPAELKKQLGEAVREGAAELGRSIAGGTRALSLPK